MWKPALYINCQLHSCAMWHKHHIPPQHHSLDCKKEITGSPHPCTLSPNLLTYFVSTDRVHIMYSILFTRANTPATYKKLCW